MSLLHNSKSDDEQTTLYMYSIRGELKSVITPQKSIEYIHNANNQRIAKKVDGLITEKYLWLNLTTLLATYNSDDTLNTRYYYTNQRTPYKMTQNNQTYYLSYNHLGSLRTISNETGIIVKEIRYSAYGEILEDTNDSLHVSFGFAGGLYDKDTNLTRFGYRDYDAESGKWTAKDPIGFSGDDSNLYGYVFNDPVNGVDPLGLVDLNLFEPNTLGYYQAETVGWQYSGYTVGGHCLPAWNQSIKCPHASTWPPTRINTWPLDC